MNLKKWILLAFLVLAFGWALSTIPSKAECTGCGDGGHGTCIEKPGHTHDDEQGHEHEKGTWLDHKHAKDKRNKMYPGETVFTMTCDKVNAKIRIKEDGEWEILDILGRHEEAYREKKSWE